MKSVRSRLTYANVVSTIALFLVLGGATAFAAKALAPNSVGTKQLQQEAVTRAKIRNAAVSAAKLGNGSVTGAKLSDGAVGAAKLGNGSVTGAKLGAGAVGTGNLADGSVTAEKLANGTIPGAPVVRHLGGAATLEFPKVTKTPAPVVFPLANMTYTQPAGETDLFVPSLQLHIPASCTGPRSATAILSIDAGGGSPANELAGRIDYQDSFAGEETVTVNFIDSEGRHGLFATAPAVATQHTFTIKLNGATCNGKAEVASGIAATGAQIDVIGFR